MATGTRGRSSDGKFTRTAASARRDHKAAELHGQGWTYARIAAELGFASKGKAHEAVMRAYAEIPTEEASQARQADLDRIDRLIEQAWEVMLTPHLTVNNGKVIRQFVGLETDEDGIERLDMDGKPIPVFADVLDDGPRLAAVNTIKGLLERRARIFGYDAPAKSRVEVITADMIESQIADLESQLARNDPAGTGTP
jgi:hypothetical protein